MIHSNELETISLTELLEAEERQGEVAEFLKTFSCKANKDVQNYLWDKAIESEKRSFAKTTLVIYQNKIVGYFTMLIKNFLFTEASGNVRQQLTGNKKADSFITILIAQLGRSDSYRGLVSGSTILNLALEKSEDIKNLSALRVVCVEHDDNKNLNIFYEENEFKMLQVNSNEKIMRFVRL